MLTYLYVYIYISICIICIFLYVLYVYIYIWGRMGDNLYRSGMRLRRETQLGPS